jgi:hypothetical protein
MVSGRGSSRDQKIDNRRRIRDRRQYSEMKSIECASLVRHLGTPSRASTKQASSINGASSAGFVWFTDAVYQAIRGFRAPSTR